MIYNEIRRETSSCSAHGGCVNIRLLRFIIHSFTHSSYVYFLISNSHFRYSLPLPHISTGMVFTFHYTVLFSTAEKYPFFFFGWAFCFFLSGIRLLILFCFSPLFPTDYWALEVCSCWCVYTFKLLASGCWREFYLVHNAVQCPLEVNC